MTEQNAIHLNSYIWGLPDEAIIEILKSMSWEEIVLLFKIVKDA